MKYGFTWAYLDVLQLLQRLITERRHSMDSMMSEGPRLLEAHPGEEGEQAKVKLSTLQQKWEALQLEAEQRSTTFTGNATRSLDKAYCIIQIFLTDGNSQWTFCFLIGGRIWSSFYPGPSFSRKE